MLYAFLQYAQFIDITHNITTGGMYYDRIYSKT